LIEALFWTSVAWALIFGNAAAQVVWFLFSRPDHDISRLG